MSLRSPSLDDVFLALTGRTRRRTAHDHPDDAATAAAPLVAERQFIKRSLLHTLRTPDVSIMAIALPTILMVLFTLRLRRRDRRQRRYVNYVVPGIILLLCAGFGVGQHVRSTSRAT